MLDHIYILTRGEDQYWFDPTGSRLNDLFEITNISSDIRSTPIVGKNETHEQNIEKYMEEFFFQIEHMFVQQCCALSDQEFRPFKTELRDTIGDFALQRKAWLQAIDAHLCQLTQSNAELADMLTRENDLNSEEKQLFDAFLADDLVKPTQIWLGDNHLLYPPILKLLHRHSSKNIHRFCNFFLEMYRDNSRISVEYLFTLLREFKEKRLLALQNDPTQQVIYDLASNQEVANSNANAGAYDDDDEEFMPYLQISMSIFKNVCVSSGITLLGVQTAAEIFAAKKAKKTTLNVFNSADAKHQLAHPSAANAANDPTVNGPSTTIAAHTPTSTTKDVSDDKEGTDGKDAKSANSKTAQVLRKTTCSETLLLLMANYPPPQSELKYRNNFELLCAVVLANRSSEAAVNAASQELFAAAPNPKDMAALGAAGIAPYIKSLALWQAKAERLAQIAQAIHHDFNDKMPYDSETLQKLPSIGPKTAQQILSLCRDQPFTADTHVMRVCKRMGLCSGETKEQIEKQLTEMVDPEVKYYVQYALREHGREVCTAKNFANNCATCIVAAWCKNNQRR